MLPSGVSARRLLAAPLNIVLLDYRDIEHPLAGGAEIYLNEIFQRVAARGHKVTLISGRYPGSPPEAQVGAFRVLRVGNMATMNFAGALAARRLAQRERVDLVVENICKIPFFSPLYTATPVLPIVLHLFGDTVFEETNVAFGSYVWLYEQMIPRAYRGLRCVTISQSTADDLAHRGLVTPQTDIVSPGIEIERYPADRRKDETPLIVYLGMLKRYKGIDIVLRAFARARRRLPTARFALLGKGTDRPRLEGLVRELGLGDSVLFLGWVSEEEKVDWLSRAHAMVYPSLKEGWGIPTVEAGACRTPTLASHVAGLRDAVRHGETGYLVEHADEAAWAARIEEVLGDVALSEKLGAGARRWAERFTWDAQAERMMPVIEAVANKSRR